jgi:hypothetical protein
MYGRRPSCPNQQSAQRPSEASVGEPKIPKSRGLNTLYRQIHDRLGAQTSSARGQPTRGASSSPSGTRLNYIDARHPGGFKITTGFPTAPEVHPFPGSCLQITSKASQLSSRPLLRTPLNPGGSATSGEIVLSMVGVCQPVLAAQRVPLSCTVRCTGRGADMNTSSNKKSPST